MTRGRTREAAVNTFSGACSASSSVQQWNASRQSEADRPVGFSVASAQSRSISLRSRSRSAAPRVPRTSHVICHLRRGRRRARRLDDIPQRTRTMGSSRGRVYRPADLEGGIGREAYWQRCDRALRVQEAPANQMTDLVTTSCSLLLLCDQYADARPMIMLHPGRRSRAQWHYTDILSREGVPCFEVASNELCSRIGARQGICWSRCI